MSTPLLLLVNFGGPRTLEEIPSFLTALLTDRDVIRTYLPRPFEKWLFKQIALRRAKRLKHDYQLIGGKSPLFEDTERIALALSKSLKWEVITFHRYLVETHDRTFWQLQQASASQIIVLPFYPQFSYATTGSIARVFNERIPLLLRNRLQWIRSYSSNPHYIDAMVNCIQSFLDEHHLVDKDTMLFFSAHGLPQKFIKEGDPYEKECYSSFRTISQRFPTYPAILGFQSKFGRGKWLNPYTQDLCKNPTHWNQGRSHIVFIPLSFTSDHIETLFEIEYQYVVEIQKQGLKAFRCPALNHRSDWMDSLVKIVYESPLVSNDSLVRV